MKSVARDQPIRALARLGAEQRLTPDGRAEEGVGEEAFTGYATVSTDAGVVLRMKGVEKSAEDKVVWPN